MRYLVTPSFSEKVTRADPRTLKNVGVAIKAIESASKEQLIDRAEPLLGDDTLFVYRGDNFQVLLGFGTDNDGEYALLADLIVQGGIAFRPLPSQDPQQNMAVDPHRNMAIDPRRNMAIDPRRNMMLDPRRNMMVDPRRNMMVDPKRNMMVDPRRNMMIDPRRNMTIDPKRNWLIDPNRNTAWDGPYLFDVDGRVSGFIIRANDKVALVFDKSSSYVGPAVSAGENYNLFDTSGNWTGFLVKNGAGGYNQFDLNAQWTGFVVTPLNRD